MPESRKIVDSYKMGSAIGRGFSSRVYTCMHQHTKAPYAAKWIYKTSDPDPSVDLPSLFKAEISAMQRINDFIPFSFPHFIRLHHYVERDDAWVIITDLARGGDLEHKYILPAIPAALSEHRLGLIMLDVVLALKRLHDTGLLHRDIKPGNILLLTPDTDSRLALCDFGFCRDYRLDYEGLKGTPEFMAPEIYYREEYEAAADMWAVGITMFNLWFTKFPWAALEDRRLIMAEVRSLEEGWLDLGDCLSPEGADFMSQCLEPDPRKRLSAKDALYHTWLLRANDSRSQWTPGSERDTSHRDALRDNVQGVSADERQRRIGSIREGSRYLWK